MLPEDCWTEVTVRTWGKSVPCVLYTANLMQRNNEPE